jgi:hypothetical protein
LQQPTLMSSGRALYCITSRGNFGTLWSVLRALGVHWQRHEQTAADWPLCAWYCCSKYFRKQDGRIAIAK